MFGNPRGLGPSISLTWQAFGLLAIACVLLGGSSRPDALQLVPLRAIAGPALIVGLALITREQLRSISPLLIGLIALAVLMIVQLIPLPPALWQALSGRDGIVAMQQAWGVEELWRPISLVPDRTINALASLTIPLAALIAAAATKASPSKLQMVVVAIASLDAVIGILQVLGVAQLYFYSITNKVAPVGLFANENHSGVFSAFALLMIALLALEKDADRRGKIGKIALAASYFIILVSALLSGSRAGLLTTFFALTVTAAVVWVRRPSQMQGSNNPQPYWRKAAQNQFASLLFVLLPSSLVLALLFGDRIPGLVALTSDGGFESLRWSITPVLIDMVTVYGIAGTGFGAFEEAYHIFEPDTLMLDSYINQAHNDWLQLVIEGGLLALLLLAASLAWLARGFWLLKANGNMPVALLFSWIAAFLVVGLASLVDYPLRTPLGQFVGVLTLVAFAQLLRRHSFPRTQPAQAVAGLAKKQAHSASAGKSCLGFQRHSKAPTLLIAALGLSLSACSGTREVGLAESIIVSELGGLPEPPSASPERIASFESLEILVMGADDLSGEYVTDENGYIFFPLIGMVDLAGLSPNSAGQKIAALLKSEFVKNPQVRILLTDREEPTVSVGGQVTRSGAYPLSREYTLLRAVNDAGGLSETADSDDVLVLRHIAGQDYIGVYNLSAIARGNYADPELFAGDIVMVGDNSTKRTILEVLKLTPFVSSFVVLINRL